MKLNWLIPALFIAAGLAAPRYGALPSAPAMEFDLQGFVDAEVRAGHQRIVVPPGRYRITPRNRQHLLLRGLKDVQIVADGVEMICTETTRAVTISHCTNVTLRGLVIDYDPLPYTQGRITAISADKQTYELELFAGYPEAATARNFKYEIFRPDTRTLRCEDRSVSQLEVLDARHLRLTSPGRRDHQAEQVGDLIVIGSEYAPHGSAAHAVECSHNVNVRLEDIELFASNCFGFLEYDCDASVYLRCRIGRRSPESDPVKRASPRLRSLNADAFHSKHAIKGPSYIECAARFMGDDCINICGDYHMVMSGQGTQWRVLAKGAMNIQPGDPVEIVLYTGERLPDARAVSVQPTGTIADDEKAFLARQQMDARLKSARGPGKVFNVTLDREVTLDRGAVLCSADRIGSGFRVKNCDFGFNRSRGILIKASHGEITGNRLQGNWMSAILVSPEYWWLEAGSSSDLKITGNTITDCGGIPICVEAAGGNGTIAPAGAHRDITIAGNTVTNCSMPGILVTSTAGLTIEDNALDLRAEPKRIPGRMRQAGLRELQPVVQINCQAQPSAANSVGGAFLVGADLSWVPQQEAEGRRFSVNGIEKDILAILREHGFNAVRLRLFCDPAASGGYSPKGYCGLESTLAMAKRVKAAGLKFLLDLHYSDTWADPAHQTIPAAWRNLDFGALTNTVYRYTKDALAEFGRQGVAPDMVQVGNEISNGLLWPSGKLDDWDKLSSLLAAGIRGTRDGAPTAKVMLHLALGGQNAKSRWFLDRVTHHSLEFDIIGQSYYPRWHGTLDDLKANLNDLAQRYRQDIMVVEHSAPNVREIINITRSLPGGKGKGAFIWEPTHPGHGGLFDKNGCGLPALSEYSRLR